MRRFRARRWVAYSAVPSWVDCITNMCRFDLRQAQAELDVAAVTAPRQLNGFYETWPILALVSERMG